MGKQDEGKGDTVMLVAYCWQFKTQAPVAHTGGNQMEKVSEHVKWKCIF
jgi:hypothetical protein